MESIEQAILSQLMGFFLPLKNRIKNSNPNIVNFKKFKLRLIKIMKVPVAYIYMRSTHCWSVIETNLNNSKVLRNTKYHIFYDSFNFSAIWHNINSISISKFILPINRKVPSSMSSKSYSFISKY